MTGLHDTDIRLDRRWRLTQAADGDAPLCSDFDCLYQNIILEALTQPGDLFYDLEWGWGLYEFIQSEPDELTRLEIVQRVTSKLRRREVIAPESILVTLDFSGDRLIIRAAFRFVDEDNPRQLNIAVDPVGVEVINGD